MSCAHGVQPSGCWIPAILGLGSAGEEQAGTDIFLSAIFLLKPVLQKDV
jgi:hypothetical protein